MTKVFLNSNPDLGKCSSSIDVLWDQHENLLSSCIDLESKVQPENHSRDFISLTRKLQTRCFRWVWFKFSEIVYLKTKPWPVKTCKHVNVISLNTIFLCYLVIDKATSNMCKVKKIIKPDTINHVSLYWVYICTQGKLQPKSCFDKINWNLEEREPCINSFHVTGLSLYPLETLENQR